jgi:hypothetical protein
MLIVDSKLGIYIEIGRKDNRIQADVKIGQE